MGSPKLQPDYGMVAVYNLGPIVMNDQQSTGLQVDVSGNLKTVGASAGTAGSAASTMTSISGGVYNATPPTYATGNATQNQSDSNGRLIITEGTLLAGEDLTTGGVGVSGVADKPVNSATYSPNFYQMPSAPVAAANIKSSPGSIQSFMVSNANAAVRYFQIHNLTATPAGAAVPLRSFPISAGSATNPAVLLIDKQYLASLLYCSTGISFGFSTTQYTYTAATPADHFIDLNYV